MGEDLGPAEPPDPGRALVEADPETLTGLERVRRAILIARGTYAAPTVPVLFCGGEGGHAVTNSSQSGHWWHPADPMIAWFCCQCGAERDGMPKDGT